MYNVKKYIQIYSCYLGYDDGDLDEDDDDSEDDESDDSDDKEDSKDGTDVAVSNMEKLNISKDVKQD